MQRARRVADASGAGGGRPARRARQPGEVLPGQPRCGCRPFSRAKGMTRARSGGSPVRPATSRSSVCQAWTRPVRQAGGVATPMTSTGSSSAFPPAYGAVRQVLATWSGSWPVVPYRRPATTTTLTTDSRQPRGCPAPTAAGRRTRRPREPSVGGTVRTQGCSQARTRSGPSRPRASSASKW